MKFNFAFLFSAVLSVTLMVSCGKDNKGIGEPAGGNLVTHYIIINDASFSPDTVRAVRNNTYTFVNHSGSTKGIYSSDSIVINKQGIADNTSFVFTKDTVGSIIYRMAGKPSATGTIIITP